MKKLSDHNTVTITMSLQEAIEIGLFSWLADKGYEVGEPEEKTPVDTRVPTRREVETVLAAAGWTHNLSGEAWYSRDNSRWIIFKGHVSQPGEAVPPLGYCDASDEPVVIEKENCGIVSGFRPRGWAAFLASEKPR